MLSSAIVVFREVLEAALIIGIIAAALAGVRHRGRWIACGVSLGVAGACLVAMFAGVIGEWAQGVGQELFNALVLMLAVLCWPGTTSGWPATGAQWRPAHPAWGRPCRPVLSR